MVSTPMNIPKSTLQVAVCLVAAVGLLAAPATAMFAGPPPGGGGDPVVECVDKVWFNKAVIEYDDVNFQQLDNNAMAYAETAIQKCNLQGRQQREVAGEIAAHALDENVPGNLAGPTIDIAGNGHDPQEDQFYYTPWDGLI